MGEQVMVAPAAPAGSAVSSAPGAHHGIGYAAPSVLDVFEAAAHDETGALTRRTWYARAQRDLVIAAAAGRPALLLADVDHFKRCNDSYGHAAGDHVLAAVVWAVRTQLRHVDVLGRYGGDELAVLLAGDLTVDAVNGIAERIRARVERLTVHLPGNPTQPDVPGRRDGRCEVDGLTLSIGAALPALGAACPTVEELLAAADAALYAAKHAGRNTVRAVEVDACQSFAAVEPRYAR